MAFIASIGVRIIGRQVQKKVRRNIFHKLVTPALNDVGRKTRKVGPAIQSTFDSIEADTSDIDQFVKDIRKVSKELGKVAKQTGKAVARETILPTVKQRAAKSRASLAGGDTRLGSRGMATIRAVQAKGGGAIKAGGPKAPYLLGHEWGSKRFAQFPGLSKEGYIIRPAIAEKQPEFLEMYWKEIEKTMSDAFPD